MNGGYTEAERVAEPKEIFTTWREWLLFFCIQFAVIVACDGLSLLRAGILGACVGAGMSVIFRIGRELVAEIRRGKR